MSQSTVPLKKLSHIDIARKWVESFDNLEAGMLPEIEPYLTDDFELICPGDPAVVPFSGIWQGTAGHQQWLDLFFGFFERTKAEEVRYTSCDNTVIAHWSECVTLQGNVCPPVQINLFFHFLNGRLARIFDDYDTHTGSSSISTLLGLPISPPGQ